MRVLGLLVVAACSDPRAGAPAPKPAPVSDRGPSTAAVTQLAVGSMHTCALHADGRVSCWGDNAQGQLGVKDLQRSVVPVAVPGVHGAIELGATEMLTCVREARGGVDCWGLLGGTSHGPEPARVADGVAQLAGRCMRMTDGTVHCLTAQAQLVPVHGVTDAVDVSVVDVGRGCAVRRDGGVQCWIEGDLEVIREARDAVQVIATMHGPCVRRRDGSIGCWSYIGGGMRLGRGIPTEGVRGLVASGADAVCARSADDVVCWTLRTGLATMPDLPPTAPLAIGGHACVARGGRDVACWGNGTSGELGIGWSHQRPLPVRVPGLAKVVELERAQHGFATCARTADGDVWCWGNLGGNPHATPQRIAVPGPVKELVASDTLRLITSDGTLHGLPDVSRWSPADPMWQQLLTDVSAASRLCALAGGRVRCFRPYSRDDAMLVAPAIEDAVELRATRSDACVRHRGGAVSCFATHGGTSERIAMPEAVALAVDDQARCAIAVDRTLWCWGSSRSAIFSPRPVPVEVPPTRIPVGPVVAVAVASETICVVRDGGAVACWGNNSHGQLGDGTLLSRDRAVDVAGITDAIDVHVGHNYACALHRGGEVSCWGATDQGQVGTYATAKVTEPTAVVWPR